MFVAGFMDSPRMNFLAAIVIEGQGFRLAVEGDAQMDVDLAHIHARTVPGTEVVLCIRPQHLALSDDGPLRLMPDVIEQLGDVGHPDTMHGITATTVSLQGPEHGMTAARVAETDVLIWWGHCALREAGERERLWVTSRHFPIARGLPDHFELEHEEMYGEPFGVPEPLKTIRISWFAGGEVIRSGLTCRGGAGASSISARDMKPI